MTRRNDLLYNWQEVCTSLRTQTAEMLGIIQILHNVVSSFSGPELIDAEKGWHTVFADPRMQHLVLHETVSLYSKTFFNTCKHGHTHTHTETHRIRSVKSASASSSSRYK